MTIDLCLGSSAERAQAEAGWSLSGGIDRWHASSITPAVDAATEAMAEAATATRVDEGATSPGAPEAATEGELDARVGIPVGIQEIGNLEGGQIPAPMSNDYSDNLPAPMMTNAKIILK